MTSTENKAKTENVFKPAGEETLDFDDDTLKGEDSCYYRNRSCFKTGKPFFFTLRSFYRHTT